MILEGLIDKNRTWDRCRFEFASYSISGLSRTKMLWRGINHFAIIANALLCEVIDAQRPESS